MTRKQIESFDHVGSITLSDQFWKQGGRLYCDVEIYYDPKNDIGYQIFKGVDQYRFAKGSTNGAASYGKWIPCKQ